VSAPGQNGTENGYIQYVRLYSAFYCNHFVSAAKKKKKLVNLFVIASVATQYGGPLAIPGKSTMSNKKRPMEWFTHPSIPHPRGLVYNTRGLVIYKRFDDPRALQGAFGVPPPFVKGRILNVRCCVGGVETWERVTCDRHLRRCIGLGIHSVGKAAHLPDFVSVSWCFNNGELLDWGSKAFRIQMIDFTACEEHTWRRRFLNFIQVVTY
jgi:hypothetical protein